MVCPHCGKEHVCIQAVNQAQLTKKKHGFGYWLFIGWWWELLKLCIKIMYLPITLLCTIFHIGNKKTVIKNTVKKIAICQECGHSWEIK